MEAPQIDSPVSATALPKDTMQHIAEIPHVGQRYRRKRGRQIQRWLMQKTGCHVYYSHDIQNDILEIHSVWGAHRKRGPKL